MLMSGIQAVFPLVKMAAMLIMEPAFRKAMWDRGGRKQGDCIRLTPKLISIQDTGLYPTTAQQSRFKEIAPNLSGYFVGEGGTQGFLVCRDISNIAEWNSRIQANTFQHGSHIAFLQMLARGKSFLVISPLSQQQKMVSLKCCSRGRGQGPSQE